MKKKKITLVLALISLFSIGVHAQTSIILSPEIGIQSSKLKPTGDLDFRDQFQQTNVNYSAIFSYHAGVMAGIQFSGNWAILTGVRYNRKGGKVTLETRDPNNPFIFQNDNGTFTSDIGEITVVNEHNWLSIPILARGQFGETFKVGLAVGPQFNIGLGEHKETAEFSLENTNRSSEEFSEEFGEHTSSVYKKNHMSLLIQPYVAYQISRQGSIKLSLMIERGSDMVNENYVVGDGNGGTRNVNGTLKNNQFGVTLGYVHSFDLKAGVKY